MYCKEQIALRNDWKTWQNQQVLRAVVLNQWRGIKAFSLYSCFYQPIRQECWSMPRSSTFPYFALSNNIQINLSIYPCTQPLDDKCIKKGWESCTWWILEENIQDSEWVWKNAWCGHINGFQAFMTETRKRFCLWFWLFGILYTMAAKWLNGFNERTGRHLNYKGIKEYRKELENSVDGQIGSVIIFLYYGINSRS